MTPLPPDLKEALNRGLKLSQYAVMRVLVTAARPLAVAEIVTATGLSDPTIRRVLKTLCNKKLIRWSSKPMVGGARDRAVTYRIR
jgi:DNA-binding IclR family transcriptional regulator